MKNTKKFLMEKAGKIKAGGLGLGFVFLTIAVVFSAIVFTSRIEATEIKPAVISNIYYTNDTNNINLLLNGPNTLSDAFVVFTKTDTTYSLYSYISVNLVDTTAKIHTDTPWVLGTENEYYVGFTTQSEDAVKDINSFNQTEQTNPTAILFELEDVSITLKPIKVVFDDSSPVISNVTVTNNQTLKSTDTITMTFDIADPGTGVSAASIAVKMNNESPNPGSVEKVIDNTYTAVFDASSFTTYLQNGADFPYMNITIDAKDIAGNAAQYSEGRQCNLKFDNLEISNIFIKSSNSNDQLAKTGNTITLKFDTSSVIARSDITAVMIAGQNATVSADGNGGKDWKATYILQAGNITTDNLSVPISIAITNSGITKSATATSDSSAVTFYDEIVADGLKFESNYAGNPTYAVDGNILSVTFTTTHPVTIDQSTIEGNNVTFKSENSNMKWKASYDVTNPPNNGVKFTFSFRVNDAAGNASKEYSQASLTSEIIYADVLIAVTTNNTNTAYAADNNVVTLKVTSVTPLTSIDNAKIAGIPVVFVLDASNTTWTATQELTSSAAVTDKNAVPFSFNVNNGEQQKTQSSSGVTNAIYYAPIQLSNLEIKSNNSNVKKAQTDNEITLSFRTQHAIEAPRGTIASNTVTFINESGDNVTWEASYTLKASDIADTENVLFSLTVKDKAGNTATETDKDTLNPVIYYGPLQLSDVKIKSNNKNTSAAQNGNEITVSFKTQHETDTPAGEIAGKSVHFTNASGDQMTWEAIYTLKAGDVADTTIIPFSFSVQDAAGNTAAKAKDDLTSANKVTYYAPLIQSDLEFNSNNADPKQAASGNIMTVTFKVQHAIDTPVGTIAGQTAIFTNVSGDDMTWQGSYTLVTGNVADTEKVPFSLTAADAAGNTITKTQDDLDDSNQVHYLDMLQLTNAQIVSNNDNPKLAMDGNKVTVSFKTQHAIDTPVGEIAGRPVDFTNANGDKMTWQASCTLAAGNVTDQTIVPFNFEVKDAAGNSMTQTQTGFAYSVKYEAALTISDLDFKSDNAVTTLAMAEDTVTLSFKTQHAIAAPVGSIADKSVTFTNASRDQRTWQASYTLKQGDVTDNKIVLFSFSAVDSAGNTISKMDSDLADANQVTYYAPISSQNITFTSDNKIAGQGYAKDADVITLRFQTTHPVTISSSFIAGQPASIISINNNKMDWVASYTVENGKIPDNTDITFAGVITDQVGNTLQSISQDDTLKIRYQAPIQLSDVKIKSNNKNTSAAQNGNEITVSFKTQHETDTPAGEIAGKSVHFTNASGDQMTWEAIYTLKAGDVADTTIIPFSFSVQDAAGNTAAKIQDDLISTNQVTYYAPLIQSDLEFNSNNADPKQAASGNIMTVTFKVQHAIDTPVGTIAGQKAVFTNVSGDKMTWQGSYTLVTGNVADTEKVLFSLTAADAADNTVSISENNLGASNQVRYLDMLELSDVLFVSDNSASNLAKDGNNVTISFKAQHAIETPVGTIAGQTAIFTNASGDKMTWQASYTLAAGIVTDQAIVTFAFTAKDASGNETAKSQSDIAGKVIYSAALTISGLNIVSNNEVTTLALAGNTVSVTFKSQHAIAAPVGLVAGKSVTFTNADGDQMTWQAIYKLQLGDVPDNGIIPFSLSVSDSAGNTVSKTNSDLGGVDQVTYYAPISALNITFTSDNESAGVRLAKDTDIVTLRFQTTHPVTISSSCIAGQQVSITSENNNKMDWVASYTVENKKITDNTDITFAGVITDQAGNTLQSISQDDTLKIRYQAPIAEGLSAVSFVSDNAKTGTKYARNGDTATLSFTTTHPVMLSGVQINGNTGIVFSSTDNDNMHWTAKYTIPENVVADNTDISFAFSLTDASANTSVTKTKSDAEKIRYQAPISIMNLSMISDNGATSGVARNTNKITLTFQTLHPVVLTTVKIAGQEVICSSTDNDGMTWSAGYTVQNGMTADNAAISMNLLIDDLAGNASAAATENDTKTGKIIYYAPTVVSNVSISTTNSNDASCYAKDADTVYVTFVTNHDTAISDVSIAGKSPQVTKTDSTGLSKFWVLTYSLKNGDVPDLAVVSFAFTIKDIAGNDPVKKTNLEADVSHAIQYFAPITATTSIASNGSNAVFAQNGDSITVSAATNHAARVTASSVFTRGTNNSGDNSQQIAVAYTIQATESVLAEGNVPFSYTITDAAGNTLDVNKTNDSLASAVTYDRTNPQVEITPDFSGFTNQTVDFIISFSDVNLDSKGVSIKINGEEQITSSDRSSITGTAFTKKITVEADNTYTVEAAVTDKAGNQAESNARTTITIDKSNPEVSSVKIDFLTPKTYREGFVLGAYLNITEKNVDQIICTVTDSTGVHDWDINTPITTDGKNTVYLLVTDMAGNHSTALTYDLYIDGLAPQAMIRDMITGEKLTAGTDNAVFISEMTLGISLEALNIGDEAADHFTVLKLVDKNGTLVVDLLSTLTASPDGMYTLPLDVFGEYTLIAEAQDAVGNVTGSLAYHFTFRDKSLLQKYYENKPLFYSTISVLGVLAAGGVFLIIANKRRKKISPAQNHL